MAQKQGRMPGFYENGTKPYGSLNREKFCWTQYLPVDTVTSSTMKQEIKLL
jgi:hypothetical protein